MVNYSLFTFYFSTIEKKYLKQRHIDSDRYKGSINFANFI